jgi:triosephosphate isomerase
VGGNWKMNTDLASAVELADDVVAGCGQPVERCDVAVFPPFPYLQAVGRTLGHHGLLLGAQDLYHLPNGAYTGEVSTEMLLDLNVMVVLVGHSERRHVIGEDDDLVNAKLQAALEGGLDAILCVGETLEERQAGRTRQVNVGQLMSGLRDVPADQMRQVTIAYEPVWAIGTGEVSTPEDAATVHKVLRATIPRPRTPPRSTRCFGPRLPTCLTKKPASRSAYSMAARSSPRMRPGCFWSRTSTAV